MNVVQTSCNFGLLVSIQDEPFGNLDFRETMLLYVSKEPHAEIEEAT
jgi:hypothetical protein